MYRNSLQVLQGLAVIDEKIPREAICRFHEILRVVAEPEADWVPNDPDHDLSIRSYMRMEGRTAHQYYQHNLYDLVETFRGGSQVGVRWWRDTVSNQYVASYRTGYLQFDLVAPKGTLIVSTLAKCDEETEEWTFNVSLCGWLSFQRGDYDELGWERTRLEGEQLQRFMVALVRQGMKEADEIACEYKPDRKYRRGRLAKKLGYFKRLAAMLEVELPPDNDLLDGTGVPVPAPRK